MRLAVMLTSFAYATSHWGVAVGARIEFRGAGRRHRGGAHSRRGNRPGDQQPRRGAGARARHGTKDSFPGDPVEGLAARSLRPARCGGTEAGGRRIGVPRGLHASAVALLCGVLSAAHSEYSPFAPAII